MRLAIITREKYGDALKIFDLLWEEESVVCPGSLWAWWKDAKVATWEQMMRLSRHEGDQEESRVGPTERKAWAKQAALGRLALF